jgi:hypothetical protein
MTRREPFTFIDFHSNDEPRKAFCRICEELTGRLNKLVPRLVDGIEDDRFKICSYCGEIYPIYDIKLESMLKDRTSILLDLNDDDIRDSE